MAEAKLCVNIGGDTVQVTVVVGQAVGIHLRPEDTEKLLYVGKNGKVSVLELGSGLAIRNGVLVLTGVIAPDEEIYFVDNGDGSVTLAGVTFTQGSDGTVMLDNATLTQGDDNVVLMS